MSFSNADPRDDSVQVVDGVIDALLIDNAVKSLGAESATEGIYTELKWTDACEDLLRTYREKIHPSVCQRATASSIVLISFTGRQSTADCQLRQISHRNATNVQARCAHQPQRSEGS